MFESLRKFVDILFKSLSIMVIIAVGVFSVVLFKSCSSTVDMMDARQIERSK